jgi:hypothetical protein
MYLLLEMIRLMAWVLSGGLWTVRAEPALEPVEGLALALLPRIRQTGTSGVEWMSVRPVPERFGVPPGRYRVVPAFGPAGGGRRPAEYRLGAAGLFPATGPYRPRLI